MALTIVEVGTWTSGVATSVTTGTITASAGDLMLVVGAGNRSFSSMSSSDSGTWTQAVSDGFSQRIFSRAITGSASFTVTWTMSSSSGVAVAVYRVTGAAASPIGATGSNRLNSTQNYSPTVFTSTVASSVLLAVAYDVNGVGVPSSSDLTYDTFDTTGGGGFIDGIAGYKTLGSPGAQTANFDAPTSGPNWCYAAVEILPLVPLAGTATPAVLPILAPPATGTLGAPGPLTGTATPATLPVLGPPATGTLAAPTPLSGTARPAMLPILAPTATGLFLAPSVTPHQAPTYPPGQPVTSADLGWWITPRPTAYATLTSTQSIPSGGWVTVPTATVTLDRDSGFANVATNGGYALGATLGAYRVSASATFAASTAGTVRKVRLILNGGPVPGAVAQVPAPALSAAITVQVPPALIASTATTDVLALQVWQDTGTTLNATAASLRIDYAGAVGTLLAPVGITEGVESADSGAALAVPGVPVISGTTSTSYQPASGAGQASITLSWSQPLNADGSTDAQGDRYEVQWQPTGATTWQTQSVGWDQHTTTVNGLVLGTSYGFQIRAVNTNGSDTSYGAWSATTTAVSSHDVTPPGKPAVATVAASLIAVQITHDLTLDAGGPLPADMDHIEIHLGTSSGFTPSTLTLAGKLPANQGMITAGIPAVGTFATSNTSTVWVKVIAVDASGNRSTPSVGASSTAILIDDSHIGSLTASKITAGTITAAVVIGASATFSGSLSAATGTFAGSLSAATGTFTGALSGATGTFSGALSAATGTFYGTVSTAASGQRITVDPGGVNPTIWLYPSTGSDGAFINATSSTVAGFNSATGGGATRTRVYLAPHDGYFECIDAGTQAQAGGQLHVTAGGAYLSTTSGPVECTGSNGAYYGSTSGTVTVGSSNNNYASFDGATATITGGGGTSYITVTSTTIMNSSTAFKSDAVYNSTTGSAGNVFVNNTFQMYRSTSSRRYKVEILPERFDTDAFLALSPVSYYDRGEWERNGESPDGLRRYMGYVAEDVAEVAGVGEWIVPLDGDGMPETVEYQRIVVPLVQAVREDRAKLRAAITEVADLRAQVDQLLKGSAA